MGNRSGKISEPKVDEVQIERAKQCICRLKYSVAELEEKILELERRALFSSPEEKEFILHQKYFLHLQKKKVSAQINLMSRVLDRMEMTADDDSVCSEDCESIDGCA